MGGGKAVAARLEGGAVTFKEFRNALCILRSLDRHELVEAGCIEDTDIHRWPSFRDGPYDWLLCADDPTTDKLWALMIKRGVEPDLSGAWRGR